MLNRYIYEALPYAYVATGTAVVLSQHNSLAWLSGLLLYAAGAMIWLIRARHRTVQRQAPRRRGLMPRAIYEAAPFLYIAAGMAATLIYLYYPGYQSPYLTLAAAVMFYGAGLGSWLLRVWLRGYHRTAAVRVESR